MLQSLTLGKDTVGGAEAYMPAFEDALTNLEEVGPFLNGILDG